jgi:hypothetical protein
MQKWEISVVVAFFVLFIILFFSVEQPWQPKTSKVGEMVMVDDVVFSVDSVSVADHFDISFEDMSKNTIGYKDYDAGVSWKFVILEMYISALEEADGAITFSAGRIEDENGMTYDYYSLLQGQNVQSYIPSGTPYHGIYRYERYINLPPGEGEFISVAYKIPTNMVPEKFHYFILTSRLRYGEIILKN